MDGWEMIFSFWDILLMKEENPANQLRLVAYPTIYKVFYIPGGAGVLPSTEFSGGFLAVSFRECNNLRSLWYQLGTSFQIHCF